MKRMLSAYLTTDLRLRQVAGHGEARRCATFDVVSISWNTPRCAIWRLARPLSRSRRGMIAVRHGAAETARSGPQIVLPHGGQR
jgi:hypothetical protein